MEPSARIYTLHSLQELHLIDVTENIKLIIQFPLGVSASEVVNGRTNLSSVVIWKDSSCILLSDWQHTELHIITNDNAFQLPIQICKPQHHL